METGTEDVGELRPCRRKATWLQTVLAGDIASMMSTSI